MRWKRGCALPPNRTRQRCACDCEPTGRRSVRNRGHPISRDSRRRPDARWHARDVGGVTLHNNVLFRVSRRSPLARPLSTLLTRMDAPLVSATREAAAHSPLAVTPAASTASTASSLRAYAAHAMGARAVDTIARLARRRWCQRRQLRAGPGSRPRRRDPRRSPARSCLRRRVARAKAGVSRRRRRAPPRLSARRARRRRAPPRTAPTSNSARARRSIFFFVAFFSSSPTRDAANAASTTRSSPLRAASSNAFTRTARPRPVTGRERSRSRSRPAFTHTSISGSAPPRAKTCVASTARAVMAACSAGYPSPSRAPSTPVASRSSMRASTRQLFARAATCAAVLA